LFLGIVFVAGGAFIYILLRPSVLASSLPGDEVFFYHNDHLGTPIKMTDAAGNVVWSADYLPFGEVVIDPASTITNNFRFPGQYWDEETGLNYNWHRYYEPTIGRYLTPDPAHLAYIGVDISPLIKWLLIRICG